MRDVIALVNLHNSSELKPLTNSRPLASTTFLGRFTFIDFALSNLTNSGIDNIGILVKNHSRSIFKHLGSGTNYLKNPKTGFQSLFINELGLTNPGFNTDINNIKENDWFLYDKDAKYIIVVPIQFVYRVNFDEIIKEHIKSQHMISLVYLPTEEADKKYLNCDKITVDVLENVSDLKICVAYSLDGKIITSLPASASDYARCIPVYKTFKTIPAFDKGKIHKFSDLPIEAQEYLNFISDTLKARISILSLGSDRNDTIVFNQIF